MNEKNALRRSGLLRQGKNFGRTNEAALIRRGQSVPGVETPREEPGLVRQQEGLGSECGHQREW